jgi:molecular chaperone GrpE
MADQTTNEQAEVVAEEEAATATREARGLGAEAPAPAGEGEARDRAAAEAAADEPLEPAEVLGPEDDELTAARQQAGEYLALAQRTQADFENYRKRMARETAAAGDRGVGRLAKELLPALDHFELALRSVQADEETRKGFALVRDELVKALGRVGVEPFSPEGEAFDPVEHEAMAQHAVEGAPAGSVVEVYQQGYRLNGSVLRPARVVVAA